MQLSGLQGLSEQAAEFVNTLPSFEERPLPPGPDDIAGWVAYRQKVEPRSLLLSRDAEQNYSDELEEVRNINIGKLQAVKVVPAKKTAAPLLVFLHGGAYTTFSARTSSFSTIPLAVRLQAELIAIDYPKAPESSFREIVPATAQAVEELILSASQDQGVVLVGDSAGGGLALSVLCCLHQAGKCLPVGLVLISPWVDLGANNKTIEDPILRYEADLENAALAYAQLSDHQHPLASPTFVKFGDWCPPVLIQAGTREILTDSIVLLHERLEMAGVDSRLMTFAGMYHSFPTLTPDVPESQLAHNAMRDFVFEL